MHHFRIHLSWLLFPVHSLLRQYSDRFQAGGSMGRNRTFHSLHRLCRVGTCAYHIRCRLDGTVRGRCHRILHFLLWQYGVHVPGTDRRLHREFRTYEYHVPDFPVHQRKDALCVLGCSSQTGFRLPFQTYRHSWHWLHPYHKAILRKNWCLWCSWSNGARR